MRDLTEEEFREHYPALWRRWKREELKKLTKAAKKERARAAWAKAVLQERYPRYSKRWTRDEDKHLRLYWGEHTLGHLARMLERSPRGVQERARKLDLGPADRRLGGASLRSIAKRTGFSRTTILNAAKVLRIRLRHRKRTYPGPGQHVRTYYITPEQQDRIVAFLLPREKRLVVAKGWKHPAHAGRCLGCTRDDVPYFALDRCKRCYARWRRRDPL
jgi:hypothetical protein